jgi:N-acetylneuraminate synthase/N,N'-diacetyllegionaminate synthase
MPEYVDIAGRRVGRGGRAYIIAEAGVNHGGDLTRALEMVRVAAAAGADAVKFQTFLPSELATRRARRAPYQAARLGAGGQLEMLEALALDEAAHACLRRAAAAARIAFLSTPFDAPSADLLARLGVPAFKVGSGDLTNTPLIEHVARFGRPLILSTGMAGLGEVEAALEACRLAGNDRVVLLHCTSAYPAPPQSANLRCLETLRRAFGRPVGLSDHTPGIAVALAAVALGACVIEKHFTLGRDLEGPDHAASLEPGELAALVRGVRDVEAALGDGRKRPAAVERATRRAARRSVVARRDIRRGEVIAPDMLAMKRPAGGVPPAGAAALVGRTARRDVAADEMLTWDAV